MSIEYLKMNNVAVAVVSGDEKIIIDAQSALDLAMAVKCDTGDVKMVIDKKAIVEDFFILSGGLAGDVLQKFINYNVKMAVYGDFSCYTSKPLRDFIYESNNGKDFFFVPTKEEAVRCLAEL